MGCFLACFGSSKDRKRRKQRHYKAQTRLQRNAGFSPVQSTISLVRDDSEKPTVRLTSEDIRDKPEENLSLSARKKVTFDSNVRTYDPVAVEESLDFSGDKEDGGIMKEKEEEEKEEEVDLAKLRQSPSLSEESLITSSGESYPPNHRYQNCRESDDELDYEESDVDEFDEDEDDDDENELDYSDIDEDDEIVESRSRISSARVVSEETDDSSVARDLPEGPGKLNQCARDRSAYVHSVLNPVENLSQWMAVKAKGIPPPKQQKENFKSNEEPQGVSFSPEPSFKALSSSSRAKSDQPRKSDQEIAVDASLSNWLGSSQNKTINKSSTSTPMSSNATTPEKSTSVNSTISFDDRPILGALTVEELKQMSASSTPRKSPTRSPDEMPIIGTVGTYWNHRSSGKDSGSVSSYKGIPNTTSKYREDKLVNWHSTPFETRLERALTGDAART